MLPAVLKITNREEEGILNPDDDPSVWARGNSTNLEILFKYTGGLSREVLNEIKKAYALVRRSETFMGVSFYDVGFIADCLITATMKLNPAFFLWTRINKKPGLMPYSYLLKVGSRRGVWRLEGQKKDHGIFLLDECLLNYSAILFLCL